MMMETPFNTLLLSNESCTSYNYTGLYFIKTYHVSHIPL